MDHNPTASADRPTALIVGILFIVATAFLFLGEVFYKPYLAAPNALEIAAPNKSWVVLGLGLELVCILAMPLIGAFIYPVLSAVSTGMALAYFFFRSLEAVLLIAVALTNKLTILTMSEAYVNGGDPAPLEASLSLIRAQNVWGDTAGILYNIVFVCGAYCLYAVLFRARLIPRWISGWGLISITILGAVVVMAIFVRVSPVWEVALIAPLAIQEMVMALWFIFRGFDRGALSAARARTPDLAQ